MSGRLTARSSISLALLVGLTGSCKPDAPSTPPPSDAPPAEPAEVAPDPNAEFSAAAESWVTATMARVPSRAVELGRHEYDGKIRDVTDPGLTGAVEALKQARVQFEAIDPATLDATTRVERAILLQAIRAELFDLERRRQPWTNPMFYLGDINLQPYISRDYAPIEQRAEAAATVASATRDHLDQAMARLEPALPRTFIETALLQTRGTLAFVRDDVPQAMAGLAGDPKKKLDLALTRMVTALTKYESFLVARLKSANDDYALGNEMFSAMLRETLGFDVPLERLEEIGRADLERNLAALKEAAAQIDAGKAVGRVVAKIVKDKPAADAVLAEATDQATRMRQFLIDNAIVTIPTEDVAEVRESPPFMRWNAAFLDPIGAFETAKLPSFYYISPPDPAWPNKQQRDYIPGKTDLLFITIHEVWPGHFLHGLHLKTNPSIVMKSFWNYATGEGWAHYAEEMMWDAGVSDDPAVRIGQLQNALLRNVRYLSAIGLHTGDLTVEQSTKLFKKQAFQDTANARQQAVRGTFDPMYLAYTLGKLAIMKLRTDLEAKWEAEGKELTHQAFHDALLSYGAAPLPVIREAMLGPDAGPVL